MLRNSRSTSMGLLDGLQSLQGAPPPLSTSTTTNNNNNNNNNNNKSGASAHLNHNHSHHANGGSGGLPVQVPDALGQFAAGAAGFFTDVGSKLGDTLAPAVGNLSEGAKSGVVSLRRMMGDDSLHVDDLETGSSGLSLSASAGSTTTTTPNGQTNGGCNGGGGVQQISLSDEMSTMFNLTMFQRIALFAMCFGTGILLIAMSFTFLPLIVLAPHKFAAAFTMGNLLAIVSTWILTGPRAQLQSMFAPGRAIAASVYLTSLVVTLLAAFFGGKLRYIFVLVALVCEISSLCWYALSYIPYGRQMLSRVFGMFTG